MKLTKKEMTQLERLAQRAAACGQLVVGCDCDTPMKAEGVGVSTITENADVSAWYGDAPMTLTIMLTDRDWKTVSGMRSRAKARPRKLSTEQAKKMAAIRHA